MTTLKDLPLSLADKQGAVVKAFDVVVRARKAQLSDNGLSSKTADVYKAKAEQVIAQLQKPGESIRTILTRHAPVGSTFYMMRAALVSFCKEEAGRLIKQQDALQRLEKNSDQWISEVDKLRRSLNLIDAIKDIKRADLLAESGQHRKAKHSKRADLAKLPSDWKQRMLTRSESSPTYRLPTLVSAITGCRPEELIEGIKLCFENSTFTALIKGAKASEKSGQPWRKFEFQSSALPTDVAALIKQRGSLTVKIASTSAFHSHLVRQSKELFPGKPHVTGYSFRHSITEDLREAGWSAEELAGFLGQLVSETQASYGRRRRTGSRNPKSLPIVKGTIATARPVRPLERVQFSKFTAVDSAPPKNH